MKKPVIGLTTSRFERKPGQTNIGIVEAYVRALSRAGAAPLLIPLGLLEDALDAILPRLDGVLFTGGGDVHPYRYAAEEHSTLDSVDEDRDRVELHLARVVIQAGLPIFGICRGIQLINVALGGTLYLDVPSQLPGALKHRTDSSRARNYPAHTVRVEKDSRLSLILGSNEHPVNSWHHQGLRDLAPGLHPVAYSADGLIEAVELSNYPFGLAVQWHPEWMPEHIPMQALFRAFVDASTRNA